MKYFLVFVLLLIGSFFLGTQVLAVQQPKVTICHRTGSNSNPYVINHPDETADVQGHNGHNGPIWFPGIQVDWGDIIPPFVNGSIHYPGKNWTTLGQQIWNNDCEVPFHNACNEDQTCARVEGSGSNTCQNNNDCKPKFHFACTEENTCAKVEGIGENTCDSNEDCKPFHFACNSDKVCAKVEGSGKNTCDGNDDCKTPPPTHLACQDNACVKVDGAGDDSCKTNIDCQPTTPPSNPPSDNGGGGSANTISAPTCPDGNTTKTVANPHVTRTGSHATVSFFITEGDSANIYYKVDGQGGWQYSVLDVKGVDVNGTSDKFVSYTINDLNPALGYDFGFQQKFGCGGGQIVTAVVVDSNAPATFGLSYYQW